MSAELVTPRPWWGEVPLAVGESGLFRLGPLTLWLQRLAAELRLARDQGEDPLATHFERRIPAHPPDLMAFPILERFGLGAVNSKIALEPSLADRPVVSTPERPFSVAPGVEITLFVSSPLWIRMRLGDQSLVAADFPIFRPSDTWFGVTTSRGELCYGVKTFCRLRQEDLPIRPHRAVTAVRIENHAASPLMIERVKIPVPSLGLYESGGRLWTEGVTIERTRDGDLAEMRIGSVSGGDSGRTHLASAREPLRENIVERAFGGLLDWQTEGGLR